MWYLVLMAIGYLIINFFLWHRAVRFLKNVHGFFGRRWVMILFTILYVFLMTSVVSWVLFDDPDWVATMKYINNVWIGIFIYSILWVVVAELVTLLLWTLKKMRKGDDGYRKFIVTRGSLVLLLVLGFSLYGVIRADDLTVTEYDVEVAKTSETGDDLKVVLVADTHIGYSVGTDMMEQMVETINRQEPDVVCIAGDIIDNDYYAMEDVDKMEAVLSGIRSEYGVYACYGNHDVEEKLIGGFTVALGEQVLVQKEIDDFLKRAGIEVLEDESVLIGEDITLIGRVDVEKPNQKTGERKSIEALTEDVEQGNTIITVDHQPAELEEKAAAGVDIDLGGHTHDGQIFPGNLTIDLFWDNAYGMLKVDEMYSIVTSGVGVWGPAMRVGTRGEVVVINVAFTGVQN